MTRQDVIATLRDLIAGRLRSLPEAWRVVDGRNGIRLSVEGVLFDIEVLDAGEEAEDFDAVLDGLSQDERDAFARSLDEAADEAEREGPVSTAELRRSLDEAIERGLAERARSRRASR